MLGASGEESELPDVFTFFAAGDGVGPVELAASPGTVAIAGVMPSVIGCAGESFDAGVGPIALFEESVADTGCMLAPISEPVVVVGSCAGETVPPHAATSNEATTSGSLTFMLLVEEQVASPLVKRGSTEKTAASTQRGCSVPALARHKIMATWHPRSERRRLVPPMATISSASSSTA